MWVIRVYDTTEDSLFLQTLIPEQSGLAHARWVERKLAESFKLGDGFRVVSWALTQEAREDATLWLLALEEDVLEPTLMSSFIGPELGKAHALITHRELTKTHGAKVKLLYGIQKPPNESFEALRH
jgi:hypothetical protein